MIYKVKESLVKKMEDRIGNLHDGKITEERLMKDYLDNALKQGKTFNNEWAKAQISLAVKGGLFTQIAEKAVETKKTVYVTKNSDNDKKDN